MESYQYLAFYKPFGVLSCFTDDEGRDTLKKYIDIPGIYSAGRLDYDSEGLLLLTNDGGLIHQLTDPRHHISKTYLVQVEGEVTEQALARLQQGVVIQGYQTKRCKATSIATPDLPPRARPITPHGPTAWLRMELQEGKKRQIRHMTAAVGLPTLRLVRVAIGPIGLAGLQPGEWRELTVKEISLLKSTLKKLKA